MFLVLFCMGVSNSRCVFSLIENRYLVLSQCTYVVLDEVSVRHTKYEMCTTCIPSPSSLPDGACEVKVPSM